MACPFIAVGWHMVLGYTRFPTVGGGRMSALAVSVIVFLCVFGGTLVGMLLSRVLPEHHFSEDTKDVIKVAMAMVATLTALVLGLMIAAAKSSLDDKKTELRSTAARVLLLDRTLAEYGPEAKEARDLLKKMLTARINEIWLEENTEIAAVEQAVGRDIGVETIQVMLLKLMPENDAQRWLQSTALQISSDLAAAHWTSFEQLQSTVDWPFLIVVVFWLAVIFASFGVFAPFNSSVTVALFLAALSVAGSIYLMLEMDQPYSGPIKISSAPLRMALQQLGRP